MITKIQNFLKNHDIDDIYIVGFFDIEDEIAEFYPNLCYIFIEMGNKYIKFESTEQFSKLHIQIVDTILYEFEIDEDMIYGKTSVKDIILTASMAIGNRLKKLSIFNFNEYDNAIRCDAIQIELLNGQQLFLDPSFLFGINIGGLEQRRFWEENLISRKNFIPKETHILICQ